MVNIAQHKKNRNVFRQKRFKYSLVASALLGITSTSINAQESEADDETLVEVIDVKGTRGALINAQNMRREAETLLDALSASDIGALPDTSILEAISRVPGVSIGRFAAPNDPDHFGTEGSGVVIRGLTQVRSEFNGRDTFTANSGRSLSFEDIPPELIGSVEVFKNHTADMVEGGIAGTVNLVTKKPFDNGGGRKISVAANLTYGDFIEETEPSLFALYSDTFENDAGRFGWLLNVSTSKLQGQSDGAQVGIYDAHAAFDNQLVPRSTRFTRKKDDREREGFAAVLQYENLDNTVAVTAEFIRSDAALAWTENAVEWADDNIIGSTMPAAGTSYEFGDNGFFQNGYLTGNEGWRGADSERQPGGQYGILHAMVGRFRNDESTVQDINLNVEYTPTDQLAFNFDLQRVEADTQILDFQVQGGNYLVPRLDLRSDIPSIELRNPGFASGSDSPSQNYFTDPRYTFWRSAMDHLSDNEGEQTSIRFDSKYIFESGFITSLSAGVRYAERDQTTRESTFNWGNLTTPWSGDTSTNFWFDDERTGALETEVVSFDNFARGGVLNIEGGQNLLFPALSVARDYRGSIPDLKAISGGWRPLNERDGVIPGTDFLPGEINTTIEESTAFYVKANFEGELDNGVVYTGNFGARYVELENETVGAIVFPDNRPHPEDPNALDNFLISDQAAFGDNSSVDLVSQSTYDTILPSFNLKVELSDTFLIRFGLSEAIALPQLGLLRNRFVISSREQIVERGDVDSDGDGQNDVISTRYRRYEANAGNPNLQPMEAINTDLTFEWYFAEDGSLTTSLFYKDLENYFITGSNPQEFTNNGSTQVVEVMQSTNGDSGRIHGFELAYQQYFKNLPEGFDGLGLQLNYTYVDEKGSPNSDLSPDSPGNPLTSGSQFTGVPLEGLSQHTFNSTLLYQKYGIDARLAYNWRSQYLLTTRDVITQLPIFSKEAGFLDGSIYYDVNENIQVGLQMTNLLDTESVTRMQVNQAGDLATRGVFVSDRRFALVLRGNF
ncbi:TonB-dependent receptor [Agaribacter flavus]|uniref:TonB-dependent receptor n=1 Tax=Agaribacter flavus TaxID=1902781 RepID=A0ABV7FPP8_9ALTE